MKWFIYVICLVTFLNFVSRVQAVGAYPQGSGGFDISFPQCPDSFPSDQYDFGIVGVTHGKAFTHNDCLLQQYFLAKKANKPVSLYMNVNFPSGDTQTFGLTGPQGNCKRGDWMCQGYNYGYNAAADAFAYANSQFSFAHTWWLDVETANTWSDNLLLNSYVVQGGIDFFTSEHITVGIYSTKREWTIVMGNTFIPKQDFITPVPNWIGTGQDYIDGARCLYPFISDSSVWMIQYNKDGYDWNYVCL